MSPKHCVLVTIIVENHFPFLVQRETRIILSLMHIKRVEFALSLVFDDQTKKVTLTNILLFSVRPTQINGHPVVWWSDSKRWWKIKQHLNVRYFFWNVDSFTRSLCGNRICRQNILRIWKYWIDALELTNNKSHDKFGIEYHRVSLKWHWRFDLQLLSLSTSWVICILVKYQQSYIRAQCCLDLLRCVARCIITVANRQRVYWCVRCGKIWIYRYIK